MPKTAGGRPRVLRGLNRVNAVRSIKKRGLTKTQEALAEKGIKVSIGTLCNLAKEEGITLRQGRPPRLAA